MIILSTSNAGILGGSSGGIRLLSGASNLGPSGSILLLSGSSVLGIAGSINITVGDGNSGVGGNVTINAGSTHGISGFSGEIVSIYSGHSKTTSIDMFPM